MLEFTKTFLILFKYKYRRKWLILLLLLLFCLLEVVSECNENNCLNGVCNNDICVCNEGWRGPECQHCDSKIKLTNRVGWLSDGPNNYSVNVKCSWLITSDTVEPIRLRLETFATECGWDHLYIYDGDSVRAPLLAVYSGILDETWDLWSRQVIAHSGRALIHFFSDDAFSLPGFNVSYAVGWCPSDRAETNCSDHGTCSDGGVCICDTGWKGLACEKNMCPKNCSWVNGGGVCTEHGCQCENGRRGEDCSHYEHQDYWEVLNDWNNGTGVASHTLLWWNGRIMRVGGETHGELDDSEPILSELKPSGEWETVDVTGETPAPRYLHAATVVGDTLYVYGGAVLAGPSRDVGGREARTQHVTNELWTLSGTPPVWRNVTPAGPRVAGHTLLAVPHRDRVLLLTFFGHSPELGYMAWTRELREGVWWTWTTRGSAARGGFAHSVAWDPLSGRILMHGGLVSQSESGQRASSALYELDPTRRHWRKLSDAPHARYMHTALIVQPGVMLVFGGNVHNESGTYSKCFSNSASLYSIRDDMWYEVHAPPGTAPRAAHSMILASQPNYTYTGVYDVIVHGGFSGRLRSDTVQLHFGSCKGRQMHECFGTCRWSDRGCIRPDFNSPCISNDCTGCLQSGCVWCGNRCTSKATNCNVHETQRPVVIIQDCTDLVEERERDHCGRLHSCAGCHAHSLGCAWDYETARCRPHNSSHDKTMSCGVSCDSLSTCTNCTAEECIWCSSTMRCVDKNAYSASFPLGGCRAWSTSWCGETHTPIDMQTDVSPATGGGGLSSVDGCGAHATCSSCRREPACGWCDDGSGTGRGTCVAGSQREPHVHHCEAGSWYWESCPACQCNGHSVCDNITNVCLQPCSGRSVGEHCETCAPMHYGNPLNGGECRPCTCVGAAASCVSESGRCVCAVKGLAGDKCDRCDANNHYHSDPHNKGNCYYDLAIDYQFTFNLSKKEDRHLRAINFRNAPVKADVDADFSISCSSSARLNLTVRTRTMPERILIHDLNCTTFRYRFAKSEHAFGVEENMTLTTFFVYVYDFKPPLWIQISFSQYPKLNLQQFFVTFSSCFLLLLLVAGALWKAKQRYDAVRRRRRLYLEMEQMASRAFAQLQLELTPGSGASESGWASPVSLEPCAGGGAAVLSLVVRLPTGGTQRAPPHGGLALASALVALGHHHREDKL